VACFGVALFAVPAAMLLTGAAALALAGIRRE
jgi:hypothetical protein